MIYTYERWIAAPFKRSRTFRALYLLGGSENFDMECKQVISKLTEAHLPNAKHSLFQLTPTIFSCPGFTDGRLWHDGFIGEQCLYLGSVMRAKLSSPEVEPV